jgi:hypothetical protein
VNLSPLYSSPYTVIASATNYLDFNKKIIKQLATESTENTEVFVRVSKSTLSLWLKKENSYWVSGDYGLGTAAGNEDKVL